MVAEEFLFGLALVTGRICPLCCCQPFTVCIRTVSLHQRYKNRSESSSFSQPSGRTQLANSLVQTSLPSALSSRNCWAGECHNPYFSLASIPRTYSTCNSLVQTSLPPAFSSRNRCSRAGWQIPPHRWLLVAPPPLSVLKLVGGETCTLPRSERLGCNMISLTLHPSLSHSRGWRWGDGCALTG